MAGKSKKTDSQELYTEEQSKLIEMHIREHFGEASNFYKNTDDKKISLEINMIPPNRKKPYVTLVTSGLGAHVMKGRARKGHVITNRAELVMYMPAYWHTDEDDDDSFWPIRLIDLISEFATESDTWLAWGHTIDYGEGFVEQTGFRGILLLMAAAGEDSWNCRFSENDKVKFYQVVPLFESELRFAVKNGPAALAEIMGEDMRGMADSDRKSYVPDNFEDILDNAETHSSKIVEKELDIPETNGADHIAAYLKWIILHDMINEEFTEHFDEELEQIKSGKLDVRTFLMNSLGGELDTELFTDEAKDFSEWYYYFYGSDEHPCYPSDVDAMALEYFGEERYNCEEFGNEAYLFVPYDEAYHERLASYIDKAYEIFREK